jgi:cytochrome o ubiquinol oxidase subunit 2
MRGRMPDAMSIRRLRMCLYWIVLTVLVGCHRAPTPPPFKASSATPFLTFIDPQGPIAAAQRAHLIRVVILLAIVVVPVLVLTPILVWRYRLNGSATYTPKWSFAWPFEFLVWGVPIAVVGGLAFWIHHDTIALDPYAPLAASEPPLQVEVVGYDWKWLFIYPQFNIASIGELAFPAGRPLSIALTSDTVMQSFFIPALGSQIYAMPGMITRLHLLANAPGRSRGENTQFNGTGFYQENFVATAMTQDDFNAWVKRVQTAGIPLSPKAYAAISQRSTLSDTRGVLGVGQKQNEPLFFTDVSPNLFASIVQSFDTGMRGSSMQTGAHGAAPAAAGH